MKELYSMPKGAQIKTLSKHFRNKIRSVSNDFGLNATYSDIIMFLSRKGPSSQNDIVDKTHLSKPTISITLKNMESLGYITREQDENDSRKVIVSLTDEGLKYDEKIREVFEIVESQMVNGISKSDLDKLTDILYLMNNNLMEGEDDK